MNKYTFFWRGGMVEVLEGNSASDALNRAGYGMGSLPALDFYGEGNIQDDYKFINGEWRSKKYE